MSSVGLSRRRKWCRASKWTSVGSGSAARQRRVTSRTTRWIPVAMPAETVLDTSTNTASRTTSSRTVDAVPRATVRPKSNVSSSVTAAAPSILSRRAIVSTSSPLGNDPSTVTRAIHALARSPTGDRTSASRKTPSASSRPPSSVAAPEWSTDAAARSREPKAARSSLDSGTGTRVRCAVPPGGDRRSCRRRAARSGRVTLHESVSSIVATCRRRSLFTVSRKSTCAVARSSASRRSASPARSKG